MQYITGAGDFSQILTLYAPRNPFSPPVLYCGVVKMTGSRKEPADESRTSAIISLNDLQRSTPSNHNRQAQGLELLFSFHPLNYGNQGVLLTVFWRSGNGPEDIWVRIVPVLSCT